MLHRFLSDRRGNYALVTAVAMVPLMGAVALGVDYTEMSRQRQFTLNALDAANVATARRLIEGANAQDLVTYANEFFAANLGAVDPANVKLNVVLPTETSGGGKIKLSADLKYAPHFLPAFTERVDFSASSELQLKNTLEVALVLDNSGSMDFTGSGSGKKRMALLKDAATQLVDTLADQGKMIKQLDKAVQFAIVPFAASVNVGPSNQDAAWLDQDGISPIHHQIFNWTAFSATNKKIQQGAGGIYYKKGSDWGEEEGEKVTRFTLLDELQVVDGQSWVNTGGEYVCVRYRRGRCRKWSWQSSGYYKTSYSDYASWGGCVEARPYPYNTNDAAPTAATPATLYVPMFAPDETDKLDNYGRGAHGNWWPDISSNSNNKTRQEYTPKYFDAAPQGTSVAGPGKGPNLSCTTSPITPLTDVTETAGRDLVKAAINAMSPNGATNVPEGIGWGWRAVSGAAPFTEGRPDHHKGNDKVVIVLTDGENTYYTPSSLGYNDLGDNKSVYSAYGYTGMNQPGENTTRMYMGTGSGVNKSDFSNGTYSKAMNEQMAATCTNAKQAGLIVMTVALDLSTSNTAQNAQIEGLKACASSSRFRRDSTGNPVKLFWNSTGGDLSKTFKEIADELSNLRFVS